MSTPEPEAQLSFSGPGFTSVFCLSQNHNSPPYPLIKIQPILRQELFGRMEMKFRLV